MEHYPKTNYLNGWLKDGLQIKKDFIIINREIWNFFEDELYKSKPPIIRKSYPTETLKKEVKLNL